MLIPELAYYDLYFYVFFFLFFFLSKQLLSSVHGLYLSLCACLLFSMLPRIFLSPVQLCQQGTVFGPGICAFGRTDSPG